MKKKLFPHQKATDCTENDLPHTRLQAFFDVVKNRYDVLARIGSLFLLFALPLLAVYFFFNIYGNSLLDNYQSGSLSQEEYTSALLQWTLLKRVLESVSLLLFAFPLGASLRLIRRLAYQENIQFGGDYSLGIKKNLKECFVLTLLLALAFFVSSFAFDYGSLFYASDYGMSLAMDVPLVLSVFFFPDLSVRLCPNPGLRESPFPFLSECVGLLWKIGLPKFRARHPFLASRRRLLYPEPLCRLGFVPLRLRGLFAPDDALFLSLCVRSIRPLSE